MRVSQAPRVFNSTLTKIKSHKISSAHEKQAKQIFEQAFELLKQGKPDKAADKLHKPILEQGSKFPDSIKREAVFRYGMLGLQSFDLKNTEKSLVFNLKQLMIAVVSIQVHNLGDMMQNPITQLLLDKQHLLISKHGLREKVLPMLGQKDNLLMSILLGSKIMGYGVEYKPSKPYWQQQLTKWQEAKKSSPMIQQVPYLEKEVSDFIWSLGNYIKTLD